MNGQDVALRLYPDIHIKGGNINLARAKELISGLTDITVENAGELVQRAGVTVRAYAEVEQKFTDLLLAQGAPVTSSGMVIEKAAVQRTGGDGGQGNQGGTVNTGGDNGANIGGNTGGNNTGGEVTGDGDGD